MNILQMEDMVKGAPDDQLLQEAQQPSGQIPHFLIISEVQRRTDMRKRHQNQQQETPQGTVSDQILREGLGSMVESMPMQGPQQAPQMSSGGAVPFMAPTVSMIPATFHNQHFMIPTAGYGTDQEAFEAWLSQQNPPTVAGDSWGMAENLPSFRPDGSYIAKAPDTVGQARESATAPPPASGWDKFHETSRNIIRDIVNPIDAYNRVRGREPYDGGYLDPLFKWGKEAFDQPLNVPRNLKNTAGIFGGITDYAADVLGYSTDQLVAGTKKSIGLGAPPSGIAAVAAVADDVAAEEGAPAGIVTAVEGAKDVSGIEEVAVQGKRKPQIQALDDAQIQGKDPMQMLLAQAGKGAPPVPDMTDLISQLNKQGKGLALMQLGAGIAENNLSGGIRGAAETMQQNRSAAMQLDAQNRQMAYEAEQKQMDRDIEVYGRAAALEVQKTRADVDALINTARDDREVLRFVESQLSNVLDQAFIVPREGEDMLQARARAASELLGRWLPAEIIARYDLSGMIQGVAASGQQQQTPATTTTTTTVVDFNDL